MLSLNQGAFYNKKINSFKYLEKNKVYGNIKEGLDNYNTIISLNVPNNIYGLKVGDGNIKYTRVLSKEQKKDMKYFYDTLGKYFEMSKTAWGNFSTQTSQNDKLAGKYNTYMQNAIHGAKDSPIYAANDGSNIISTSKITLKSEKDIHGDTYSSDKPMNYKYFIDKYMNNIDGINKDIDKLMCINRTKDDTDTPDVVENDCVGTGEYRSLFERNIERNNKQKEYVDAKKEIDKLRNNKEEKIREINKYNIHMFAWSIAGISLGGIVLYCFFKK